MSVTSDTPKTIGPIDCRSHVDSPAPTRRMERDFACPVVPHEAACGVIPSPVKMGVQCGWEGTTKTIRGGFLSLLASPFPVGKAVEAVEEEEEERQ